ncbi:hypothetical protein PGTUg99_007754, partial [Puccinia graminis f. sp. tritici]
RPPSLPPPRYFQPVFPPSTAGQPLRSLPLPNLHHPPGPAILSEIFFGSSCTAEAIRRHLIPIHVTVKSL